jgi:hypothetical protein
MNDITTGRPLKLAADGRTLRVPLVQLQDVRACLDMHEVEHTIIREELLDGVPAFARIDFGPDADLAAIQCLLDDARSPRSRLSTGDLARPSR